MAESIKRLIKELNQGKNLEENLERYINQLSNLYYQDGVIRSVLDYYTLYEQTMEEGEMAGFLSEIKPVLQKGILAISDWAQLKQNGIGVLKEIQAKRSEMIKRVDILSTYVDQLKVYEYVLNRMELKFVAEETKDTEGLSEQLLKYIFSVEDNMVINERIKEVIGQLPVRMTKSRYYDIVRNSLSIYTGCDIDAVEDYLYRFKNSALLYVPEGQESYFQTWGDEIKGLQQTDFANLDGNAYEENICKVRKLAGDLVACIDLHISCQEILNSLAAVMEAGALIQDKEEWKEEIHTKEILLELFQLFEEGDGKTISEAGEKRMVFLEGHMEQGYDQIFQMEGILYDLKITSGKTELETLDKIGKLLSSSVFVDFEKKPAEGTADRDYIQQKSNRLIEELELKFGKNKQVVNRAIMANTLSVMPVFFNSTDEISQYILSSLEQCKDISEKNVSIQILNDLMAEG